MLKALNKCTWSAEIIYRQSLCIHFYSIFLKGANSFGADRTAVLMFDISFTSPSSGQKWFHI